MSETKWTQYFMMATALGGVLLIADLYNAAAFGLSVGGAGLFIYGGIALASGVLLVIAAYVWINRESNQLTDEGFGVGVEDSFADGHNWMAIADIRQHSLIGHSEARANAYLVAAAPDMAEALEELIRIDNNLFGQQRDDAMEDLIERARAALAKARGTT